MASLPTISTMFLRVLVGDRISFTSILDQRRGKVIVHMIRIISFSRFN